MKKTVILKGERFSKYEVDDKGNIYRKGSYTPLKPFSDGKGYIRVDLMSDRNEKVMAKCHLVVAHTYLGKQQEGMIINHIDGNKHNSRLNNLEYISQRENVAHAQRLIKNITYLDDDDIVDIIRLSKNGVSIKEIADIHSVPYHVIRDLLQGKTYTHIDREI